jgi:hypothetical protein
MTGKPLIIFILLTLVCFFTITNKPLADWVNSFVVWDGFIYVISDEVIDEVDQEIGHVTKYSDIEGTFSGNFSNTYRKGTKYFSIKDVSTDEAIAIKVKEGNYIKAVRDGEYAGKKSEEPFAENSGTSFVTGFSSFGFFNLLIAFLVLFPILGFVGYFMTKRNN